MIRNNKTVDPRDKNSAAVVQLETAMGAAVERFRGCRRHRGAAQPVRAGEDHG